MKNDIMGNPTNNNYLFYNLSYAIRNIALGMFMAVFNLYIVNIGFSDEFLGLFLSLGNLSMCFASIPLGFLIDKFIKDKRRYILILSLTLALCLVLETLIVNIYVLLLVSVLYGICFIGLLNVNNTYLVEISGRKNVLALNRSLLLCSFCIGTLLGGVLSNLKVSFLGNDLRFSMLGAAIIVFISCIPLLLLKPIAIKEITKENNIEITEKRPNISSILKHKRILVPIVTFAFWGLAMSLNSYLNMYLSTNFKLNVFIMTICLASIQFGISIFIYISSKYKIGKYLNKTPYLFTLLTFLIFANYTYNIVVNVICIIILFGTYNTLISTTMEKLVNGVENKYKNRLVSVLNMVYNLSESTGLYFCGLFLAKSYFPMLFIVSLVSIMIGVFLMKCFKTKDGGEEAFGQ